MLLTEKHVIRYSRKTAEIFRIIDEYCFMNKNLYNECNYLISQMKYYSVKMSRGEELTEEQEGFLKRVNQAIRDYNEGRPDKKPVPLISAENGYIADAYFLSWYLKTSENYRKTPIATNSQICIQELCRDWKSFYQAEKAYFADAQKFTGRPRKPRYKDREKGRKAVVFTSQNFRIVEQQVIFPKVLREILTVRTEKENVHQIRVGVKKKDIVIDVIYEIKEPEQKQDASRVMGIDIGVNNLLAIAGNTEMDPALISGKPIKSINQYYNKKRAELQSDAMKNNHVYMTRKMEKLTRKRNHCILDYMHKASNIVVQYAADHDIGRIVIGKSDGWKQKVKLGKGKQQNINNQNFVSIPHNKLIDMICYKAILAGIEITLVNEAYTSGTSCLDREYPCKECYDKSRRIHRGLFKSNSGRTINADINAAYQMLCIDGSIDYDQIKTENIITLKVS